MRLITDKFVLASLAVLLACSTLGSLQIAKSKLQLRYVQYDVKKIEISKDCDKFNRIGSRRAIARSSHGPQRCDSRSKDDGDNSNHDQNGKWYRQWVLAESSDILFKSKMIGGGESTTLEIECQTD